ncbi:putative methyltransferase DDB [Sesamum angolense]|uniref:Methyltransferase DDB n=1 Tax=Sesamum angolense TaxID=2727404 RepID=A0AAE2BP71_9LAMI|nr:putative methyltransferase DDB [Sesamum angolense]
MAQLFVKQAKQYSLGRPSYPQELFHFIASKTLSHDLAWDVRKRPSCQIFLTQKLHLPDQLANIYKNVVATDTSPKQLEFAAKLPNIRYQCTPPSMSIAELQDNIGSESSFDLVTIAQAMHWFDLPTFYQQVKWVLKKPNGVIAAWCYTVPEVNPTVDSLFNRFHTIDAGPYWESARTLVDQKYETIHLPFEPVDGLEHNGPFQFSSEKVIDLESYFTYLRSWSTYQTAKEKGVELLTENVLEDFKRARNEDGKFEKTVSFPIYLRIGKVGSSS